MTKNELEELRVLAFSAMHLADSMSTRAGRGDHVRGIDAEDAAYIARRLGELVFSASGDTYPAGMTSSHYHNASRESWGE